MKKIVFITVLMMTVCFLQVKGEAQMISEGKEVTMDYTLKVNNEIVDTSVGKEPLTYTQGSNVIIPGLETALEGLEPGAEKTVVVPANEAYGENNPEAVVEIPKDQLTSEETPQVGMVLQMQTNTGEAMVGIIQEVKEDALVIDFNHPLAGKELTFEVKIIGVK
ncbi:MAG: peptidylprolyl isomerase [Candidatus Omnitrophica bacterium]|nr:peptidylprolyl isomerase [Candidatus Omnitrophota bacterium]MBU4333264.1 peptidylprolyl isomerase [Candidatus Omnitrophota bacterium]